MRHRPAIALAAGWNGAGGYDPGIPTGRLRFEVLGPLRVVRDGDEVPINGAKRRALLLRLLLDANRPVATHTLVDDLWDGDPPPSGVATLHSHVSHLRRVLGVQLRTAPPGYAVDVAETELDAAAFAAAVTEGRQLVARDARRALELVADAQRMWRGDPLADVAGASWAAAECARLEEMRLVALECELEGRLALGHHAELIATAETAVAQHPLRERLWGFLITALYRDGRQADALRAYERLRRLLGDELGIEPSPELRALERAVLAQDPSLGRHTASRPAGDHQTARRSPVGPTFLMTDIVGSTGLWETAPEQMQGALARHDELLRHAIAEHGGRIFTAAGDGVAAVFPTAAGAASAALEAQARLAAQRWPEPVTVAVRMGLHTGPAEERDGDFFGPTLNRCARLTAVAHGGQVLCTAATAELLGAGGSVPLLDLGSHRLRDLSAPVSVFQVGTGSFPPLRSLDDAPSNLPTAASELVGRDDELASVAAQVRAHRIVTLTGTGGIGKTRLALAVGTALATELFDGAWIVELASVEAGGDVVGAVSAALGVPAMPGVDPLSGLLSFLADRRLLLIVDNCEHVLDPAASLASTLIASTSDVHVLATSREPLGVDGEVVRRVPPLAAPDADAPIELARRAAAVRLFVDRALASDSDFVLDEHNVAAVSRICRRLDGMPLALELAAARVRTMPVEEIDRRLDDRFRLLTGARRAVHRHRTLLATVAWSHELLTPLERTVFSQLSVFPSTFDLAAASSVASLDGFEPDDAGMDGSDIDDAVVSLVDRSLVVYEPAARRYRMLETLRQFASHRLAESGQVEAVVDRYVDHYLAFVQRVGPAAGDHRHDEAVAALTSELDNIRATVDLLTRAGGGNDVARLTLAAAHFFVQARPGESKQWLAAALDSGGLEDPQERSAGAAALAMMECNLGAVEEATRHAHEALATAREHGLGDPPMAHLALSTATSMLQDWPGTLRRAEAAVDAAARAGDEVVRIVALGQVALGLGRDGRVEQAGDAAEEALEAAVRLRNGLALTGALSCVCSAYLRSGDDAGVARALALIDRYADALAWPPDGLNRAWALIWRAIAETRRDPARSISYGVEAARGADRASPYVVDTAVAAVAAACAVSGRVGESRALVAHLEGKGYPGLEWSVPTWLAVEVGQALDVADDLPVPVPTGRRELLALLADIGGAVEAPVGA